MGIFCPETSVYVRSKFTGGRQGLLDYIGEQAKLVKPEGFQLSELVGPEFSPLDMAGLPALRFNVAEAGGAAWLRMDRLEAIDAPEVPAPLLPFASASQDPSGQPPAIIGTALEAHLAANPEVDGEEFRAAVAADFELYANDVGRDLGLRLRQGEHAFRVRTVPIVRIFHPLAQALSHRAEFQRAQFRHGLA